VVLADFKPAKVQGISNTTYFTHHLLCCSLFFSATAEDHVSS